MDCSSGSEKDFRVASSREVDLMALSQRDPGCLFRLALREMKKYLAARGEANKEDLTTGRVVSYLHPILMPRYPKAGLRSKRVGDLSHGAGHAPQRRSRSVRRPFGTKVQGHRGQPVGRRELVGGETLRVDFDTGIPEHQGRTDRSSQGGTPSFQASTAAPQRREERLGSRRRGRKDLSSRDATKQAKEGLVKETSRQSSSRKGDVCEVARRVSLREGRSPSRDKGNSPKGNSRFKFGKEGGEEKGEWARAESPVSGSWDTTS